MAHSRFTSKMPCIRGWAVASPDSMLYMSLRKPALSFYLSLLKQVSNCNGSAQKRSRCDELLHEMNRRTEDSSAYSSHGVACRAVFRPLSASVKFAAGEAAIYRHREGSQAKPTLQLQLLRRLFRSAPCKTFDANALYRSLTAT